MHTHLSMCFDRNINGNRNVKFLECNYLLVQRCVKLTLLTEKKGKGPKRLKGYVILVLTERPRKTDYFYHIHNLEIT